MVTPLPVALRLWGGDCESASVTPTAAPGLGANQRLPVTQQAGEPSEVVSKCCGKGRSGQSATSAMWRVKSPLAPFLPATRIRYSVPTTMGTSRQEAGPPQGDWPQSSLHAPASWVALVPGHPAACTDSTVSKADPQVSSFSWPVRPAVCLYQTSGLLLEFPQEEVPSGVAPVVLPRKVPPPTA